MSLGRGRLSGRLQEFLKNYRKKSVTAAAVVLVAVAVISAA